MAKSKETFSKREREKKRQKQKEEKREKKLERRTSGQPSKSFDEMLAYVDEYGQITSEAPKNKKEVEVDHELLYTGIPVREPEELEKTGVVEFFNEAKGFGFIKESKTQQRIFVHLSEVGEPLYENDRVSFQTARGARGLSATLVKKIQ